MIPIHAIATADPQQLRWMIGADRLPPAGTVGRAPGRLGALLDSGVIDEMVVRPAPNNGDKGDALITLSAGNSWRELGDDVREALSDALLSPAGWRVRRRRRHLALGGDRRGAAGRSDRRTRRIARRLDRIGFCDGRHSDRPDVGRVPRMPGRGLDTAREPAARTAPTDGATDHGMHGKRLGGNAVGQEAAVATDPLTHTRRVIHW